MIDYCNNQDFETWMKNQNKSYLSEEEALPYLRQVRDGFRELRDHKVIH